MSTRIDARNVNVVVFREFAHDDWPKVVTRGLKVVVEESLSVVIPPSLWRFYAGVSLAVLRSRPLPLHNHTLPRIGCQPFSRGRGCCLDSRLEQPCKLPY